MTPRTLAAPTCHNGSKYTNSALVNVGTDGSFKVPRLVDVIDRPPYLHDGPRRDAHRQVQGRRREPRPHVAAVRRAESPISCRTKSI